MRVLPRFLFLLIICMLTIPFFGHAQEPPRIAVIPFSVNEAAASEAKVVTSLFETAMVKTGVYTVIEQTEMDKILETQAVSLSGCTDDACAVEIGKLLSAELIVLGELSKVGGRYIANAKIIDVALGKNLNADSVSAGSIEEMTDTAVNLLAYKLAGLTYTEGTSERIAESFGEIFITTEPEEAEVFVNGVRRGTTPMVIDRVPLGEVRIVARKDNYYGERVLTLDSSETEELYMKLQVSLGNLFIKSSEKAVGVYLDGDYLGELESGFFRELPVGDHTLSLKGDSLFWEDTVTIETGKTTSVEAYPRAFGILNYELPEGAVGEVTGAGGAERITGSGEIELHVGRYRIVVTGDNYLPLETWKEIKRGESAIFAEQLEYTEEYKSVLVEEKRRKTRDDFQEEVDALERRIVSGSSRVAKVKRITEAARHLLEKFANTDYSFPDLEKDARRLLVRALENEIAFLEAMHESEVARGKNRKKLSVAGFGVGGVSVAGMGVGIFLGSREYDRYLAAETSAEAAASHSLLNLYSVLQVAGVILGAAGIITGITLPSSGADLSGITADIARLEAELAEVREAAE